MDLDKIKRAGKLFTKGKLKIVLIIVGIFLILAVLGVVLLKINFMIGEQLRMSITPEYSQKDAISPGNATFNVDVKVYNKFVCEVSCSYTLTDLSTGSIMDNGSFNSKAYKNKQYSYDINLNNNGYGTNLYLYKAECTNVKTTLCPTTGESVVRKSLVAISYSPSADQLSSMLSVRDSYAAISRNIANASSMIKGSAGVISAVNLSLDNERYYSLKSEYDSLDAGLHVVLSLWDKQDFVAVNNYISANNMMQRSYSLLNACASYLSYLNDTIKAHNVLVTEFSGVYGSLSNYEIILQRLSANSADNPYLDNSTFKSAKNSMSEWNDLVPRLAGKYDHNTLYYQILGLDADVKRIDSILMNDTRQNLEDYYPSLYVYSNMLCRSYSAMNNSMYANVTGYLCSNDYSSNLSTVADASFRLNNMCNRSEVILNNIGLLGHSGNYSMQALLLQYKLLSDYESSYGKSTYTANYKSYIQKLLYEGFNVSDAASVSSLYSFNTSALSYTDSDLILSRIRNIQASCNNSVNFPWDDNAYGLSSLSLSKLPVQHYTMPVLNLSVVPSYPISLPQVNPSCCVYGKCQSCNKTNTQDPLILLHGHLFNQDAQAYQSIEIFNDFERSFMRDKLYYQTGMLGTVENSTQGILGRYAVPLVSKPTYYIETYNDLLGLTVSESKTSNIDTYALRLKESIDYTRFITGSDKVDIVAHSMGGLVVRRYMQIFGTEHVGTVILIGTPNSGISEHTYNMCKFFGAANECDDMRSTGLFIKKLNDLSNQPKMDNLYLVVGKGCDTDGVDGDGIVTVNNSVIKSLPKDHILYVDGKCSGTIMLHNDLLNTQLHPEVYDFVKSKLGR